MRIFISTLLLSLLIPSSLQAQNSRETTEPSRFNGFESERGIELLWGIGAGSFCNGIDLQRTSDTNLFSFETIFRIEGVCGDLPTEVLYDYLDSQPISNSINYYRLLIGGIPSSTIAIKASAGFSQSVVVYPNPVKERLFIELKNFQSEPWSYELYNLQGRLIRKANSRSNAESIEIQEEPGTFMMIVTFQQKRYKYLLQFI